MSKNNDNLIMGEFNADGLELMARTIELRKGSIMTKEEILQHEPVVIVPPWMLDKIREIEKGG
jgi:hypothetical protein